jgi:hypothetical protein
VILNGCEEKSDEEESCFQEEEVNHLRFSECDFTVIIHNGKRGRQRPRFSFAS